MFLRILLSVFLAFSFSFATQFFVVNTGNPKNLVDLIKKYQNRANKAKSYGIANSFTFDYERDKIDIINDGNNTLFYLITNKFQNDPTKELISIPNLNKMNYSCDNYGLGGPNCSFTNYYSNVNFSTNTIAGWFYLTEYPKNNDKLVIINRINTKRFYPLMMDRPFFRLYVNSNGRLVLDYTLTSGGLQELITNESIPLNTRVYLQANNIGMTYEVGWKTADGVSSIKRITSQSQVEPLDLKTNITNNPDSNFTVSISFPFGASSWDMNSSQWDSNKSQWSLNQDKYEQMIKDYKVSEFYFDAYEPLFSNMNKSVKNKEVHQNMLTLDNEFLLKVYNDLLGQTNHFSPNTMQIFSYDNMLFVDVREYRN
nr:hypothetical protein [Campylobacter sp.]